ncbi:helix-turn-helix domain-containing protein [Natronobiforma cellulositropha]|uniref:helix-turn-helix domain-containing protein n=1 Tax=Natronobiforma cellulositropha TaxID=1679076 RepID=UPI0021D59894|nr:helix-turn-helix domain-containing protein [Natronobiforma cellulositropha]
MSTIAELTVPADEFALRRTLERLESLVVDVERVVAYDPDHLMPFVWLAGNEAEIAVLDDELHRDPSVESVTLLTDLGDERLYRMEWVDDVTVLLHVLTEEEATVLQATGEHSQWRLRILFPERDALSRTYEFATDQGFSLDIQRIHELDDDRYGRHGLTDAQHETLVRALERGYYEIPRHADMEELAADLGISHQALSERLRRAHKRLVEDAIELGPRE